MKQACKKHGPSFKSEVGLVGFIDNAALEISLARGWGSKPRRVYEWRSPSLFAHSVGPGDEESMSDGQLVEADTGAA